MDKKGFYVQLHLHTAESSACGKASAVEMMHACRAAGYDLVCITDHFINGNINCDKRRPWAEKVECLFRGYHLAKAAGEALGLEVLQGWETFTEGPELLTYGLGEEFLLANPDIADVPYYEYIDRVKRAGGVLIHAHPYRKAHYIPDFTPDPFSVDAYEVYNALNKPAYNEPALAEGLEKKLLMTAGADAHLAQNARLGAMRFQKPVHTIHEILSALKAGDGEILHEMPEAL